MKPGAERFVIIPLEAHLHTLQTLSKNDAFEEPINFHIKWNPACLECIPFVHFYLRFNFCWENQPSMWLQILERPTLLLYSQMEFANCSTSICSQMIRIPLFGLDAANLVSTSTCYKTHTTGSFNGLPTHTLFITVVLSFKYLLFIDDLKMFHQVESKDDVDTLQRDLYVETCWAAALKINMNASKCRSVKIYMKRNLVGWAYTNKGSALENIHFMNYLGVILDQVLTFSDHITSMVAKTNRSLGLLIRTFRTDSPRYKLNKMAVIVTHNYNVRSMFEYCPAPSPGATKRHLNRAEIVQHKILLWFPSHANPVCSSLD